MRTPAEQAKARRDCFHAHKWNDEAGKIWLTCCFCGGRIDPAREAWEAAHGLRHSLTKDNSPSNVRPAHFKCHRETVPADIRENAKGKRSSDKHFGIVRKRGFRRGTGMKFDWKQGRYVRSDATTEIEDEADCPPREGSEDACRGEAEDAAALSGTDVSGRGTERP